MPAFNGPYKKFRMQSIPVIHIACLMVLLLTRQTKGQAQADSAGNLKFSGYLEVYYNRNLNNPPGHTQPAFMYAYNRSGEFALNLGMIKATYQSEQARASLAFGAGSYMDANYSQQTGVMKSVYEASLGVKISKKENLWIDAGILPSHIGFETAAGEDCFTLTRSIMAENSPYYETGARLSYRTKSNKWYMAGLFLNGWQRISIGEGRQLPSFGHQLTFTPNDKWLFNSSSFIGNDQPDSLRKFRFFHDLYIQYKIAGKWNIIAAFDIGAEQKNKGSSSYNCWYSSAIIGQCTISEKSALGGRAEYYHDKNGVIIPAYTPNGAQIWGYSVNYDLRIGGPVLWRIEIRRFNSIDSIFLTHGTNSKNDLFFTTSLTLSF